MRNNKKQNFWLWLIAGIVFLILIIIVIILSLPKDKASNEQPQPTTETTTETTTKPAEKPTPKTKEPEPEPEPTTVPEPEPVTPSYSETGVEDDESDYYYNSEYADNAYSAGQYDRLYGYYGASLEYPDDCDQNCRDVMEDAYDEGWYDF